MEEKLIDSAEVLDPALFDGYGALHSYDEMLDESGNLQPHWQMLFDSLKQLGAQELTERQKEIHWYLKENGVTYHVYNDPAGHKRTWRLNVVPLVVQEREWEEIEQGLIQRAQIMDFMLNDLYGERRLLKEGLVPPEIIYGHGGFLRPCDGIDLMNPRSLQLYAADMARGPDGRMWIINDRTQAPSGMGYALENRLTINGVMPELFEGLKIRRLRSFFNAFKEMLVRSSVHRKENPFIVVLTPGPHNETYFEHTYLASYLGFPLVQGSDLVARDGFLWLKSLKGLRQINVVLRRVDDTYCDPLELREDSYLGVAGLLGVVRQGNVSIVNPIGSGILENPGLIPFISSVAKYCCDEELLLPQIATWWCGQKSELEYVMENLDSLVVKRIDKYRGGHSVIGNQLDEAQKERLKRQIHQMPHLYVGQEQVSFSTIPTFTQNRLEPRNSSWRAFCIADEESYSVMPGGLVRVAPERDNLYVSNQKGGDSKDIWILSSKSEEDTFVPLYQETSRHHPTNLDELPSLMAENLFWVGRYLGRTLWTARYCRTLIRLLQGAHYFEHRTNPETVRQLCMGLTHLTMTYPGFLESEKEEVLKNPKQEIFSILLDSGRPGSLAHTLDSLSSANDAVRQLWSQDAWRVFDTIMNDWEELKKGSVRSMRTVACRLDRLITQIIALMGLLEESILMEQGQLLYFIGLRLEESVLTISKMRSLIVFGQSRQVEYELLEALLSSHESLNTYRYNYRKYLQMENVVDLLLLDLKYPRSLVNKLQQLNDHLGNLPHSESSSHLMEYEKWAFEAFTKLRLSDVKELLEKEEEGEIRTNLDSLLSDIFDRLAEVSNSLTKTYFSHAYKQEPELHHLQASAQV